MGKTSELSVSPALLAGQGPHRELPPPDTVPSLAQAVRATWQRMQAQAAQVGWSLALDAQTHRYVLASEAGTAPTPALHISTAGG
jgi:hypothetical protein